MTAATAHVRTELTELLAARYGAADATLAPFYEEADAAVYRVDRASGPPWVLRLFSPSRPFERVAGDGAILRYLERHDVSTERLVAATDGALATALDGRGVVVTGFVAGSRPDRSAELLYRLGDAVGRLQAVPPAPGDDLVLSRHAASDPAEDLAAARRWLARVAGGVPPDRRARYDAIVEALEATHDCTDLPRGLTNNDRHLANARRTPAGEVVLFDLTGSGQGTQIAALGLLLFSCAVQAPDEPPAPLAVERVDPVIAGYCRYRTPSEAEVERLPDVVRVRPLVIAARTLSNAIERGEPPDPRFAWGGRYLEADAVAARARRAIQAIGRGRRAAS